MPYPPGMLIPLRSSAGNAAALAVLAVAVLPGCGSSSSSSAAHSTTTPAPPTVGQTAAPPNGAASGVLAHKPVVRRPSGPAPTHLVIRDLVAGGGPVAHSGQTLTVQYVGVLFKDGKQFDASWDRGAPFTFPLGQGQVIPGWDQGLLGMHVGGRRELTIPASLAYGAQGHPPTIPPNAPLVFVIDLVNAA